MAGAWGWAGVGGWEGGREASQEENESLGRPQGFSEPALPSRLGFSPRFQLQLD